MKSNYTCFSIFILISLLFPNFLVGQYYNQEGFVPGAKKHVFFSDEFSQLPFKVMDAQNKVVFEGETSSSLEWPYAGEKYCHADLSFLNKEGSFKIEINGNQIEFQIDKNVNENVGKALLKSFYHARVSEPILEEYAGQYARPVGHADTLVIIHESAASANRPAGSFFSSPGGWYDAGDYGKYVVNSGITTFTLLHVYELFSDAFARLNLAIPESDNNLPDILDESLVNLNWMSSMQDPTDGGIYHKLTSLKFCGMVAPHKDKLDRYVYYKSTAASLNFAATFAKASRIFNAFNDRKGLADQFIIAAERAFQWAVENPNILYENPKDVKTGEYKDKNLEDEWFWASVEMYLTTGKEEYLSTAMLEDQVFDVPAWRKTNLLGIYSLLESDRELGNKMNIDEIIQPLLLIADKKYALYQKSAFNVATDTFPWGSNSLVANEGFLCLLAYHYTKDSKYLEVADVCVNYILGANPLNKCFISGFGKNPPINFHDRRCSSDGIKAPIPGYMAGGPTLAAKEDCGVESYKSDFPSLSYLDEECSYSTNEIAINWNSAATALFLGLHYTYEKIENDEY